MSPKQRDFIFQLVQEIEQLPLLARVYPRPMFLLVQPHLNKLVVAANDVGSCCLICFNASGSSLYLAIKSPLLYLGSSITFSCALLVLNQVVRVEYRQKSF